ncbi:MAG TPA: hypothetical protein PLA94_04645 [Myxococcota bacterium]|nr:hypothetical protein [Myxococcota bacterium]
MRVLLLLPLTACGITSASVEGTWTIDSFVQVSTDVFDGDGNLEPSVTEGEAVEVPVTGTITFGADELGTVTAADSGGEPVDYAIIQWVLLESDLPDDYPSYYAERCGGEWPAPISAPELTIATEYLAFNQTWYATGGNPMTLYSLLVNEYSPTQRGCILSTLTLSK